MRNWKKEIRDPGAPSYHDPAHGVMIRLRDGRAVPLLNLYKTGDLKSCDTPCKGPYPAEQPIHTAMVGARLYVTDPGRKEFHVFETFV